MRQRPLGDWVARERRPAQGARSRGRLARLPLRRLRLPAARLRRAAACATRSSTCCTAAAGDQGDWISQGDAQEVLDAPYAANPVDGGDRRDARRHPGRVVVRPARRQHAQRAVRARLPDPVRGPPLPHDRRSPRPRDRRACPTAATGRMYLSATAPHLFDAVGGRCPRTSAGQSFTGGAELNRPTRRAWFNGHLPIRTGRATSTGSTSSSTSATSCEQRRDDGLLRDVRLRAGLRPGQPRLRRRARRRAPHRRPRLPRDRGRARLAMVVEVAPRARAAVPAAAPGEPAAGGRPRGARRRRGCRSVTGRCWTRFRVYGYDVTVHRKARELLELRDVDRDGLTARLGAADVVTAPLYRPGSRYLVTGEGAGARLASAGEDRRLRLRFDLGPPHELEQFSEEQQERERAGGYWVRRSASTP